MKSERVILSFVAVLIGLIVAGASFYLYEHYFKNSPVTSRTVTVKNVSPTPDTSNDYITIDNPTDEQVVNSHSIQVNGKATKDATIIVSTPISDQVAIASADGNFSLTTTIDDDTNIMQVTAIFPDGTEQHIMRTITYSTETF